MKRLSLNTKKEVLNFLLRTVAIRLVAKNKIEKSQPENPCYCCLRAYLDSVKTP
jgi:hypothetical protein